MIFEPFPMFLPSEYRVKFATEAWERREAAKLRRQVFCDEQGIFAGDDRDAMDDIAIPIVAISSLGVALEDVVGTVRIHEAEPRRDSGDVALARNPAACLQRRDELAKGDRARHQAAIFGNDTKPISALAIGG